MPTIFTLDLRLHDLDALRIVCRRQGWEFRAGQRTYRWFGRPLPDRPPPRGLAPHEVGRCDHAIAVPGCLYEVGLVERAAHFLPVWDDLPEGGLEVALGERGGLLWQGYVIEVATRATAQRGHVLSQLTDGLGTLRLRVVSGLPGQVAHVCVRADGAATRWDFDPGNSMTFRYLADALGQARVLEALFPDSPAVAG